MQRILFNLIKIPFSAHQNITKQLLVDGIMNQFCLHTLYLNKMISTAELSELILKYSSDGVSQILKYKHKLTKCN